MTIKEFAEMLNGREYGSEITGVEEKQAKELGFVVVFGYSDDNMELKGAIDDEFGCYGGGTAYIKENKILEVCDDECEHYIRARENSHKIKAVWGSFWTYETEIPHSKFNIYEDGTKYCEGIVFDIKSLKYGSD